MKRMNYRGAGAAVCFLMNFDGGRFRGDFIEYLRDSYNDPDRTLEEYFDRSRRDVTFMRIHSRRPSAP